MKFDVQYVAVIFVKTTIEAEGLAEATVRARFECPRREELQDKITRGALAYRVEAVAAHPFVTEAD
jgi:hypothetical protein